MNVFTQIFRGMVLLTVLIGFSSCKKENLTPDSKFIENTFFGTCFRLIPDDRDEIVIRTKGEYLDYMEQKRATATGTDCENATLPDIDFDKYSLLGTFTSGACNAVYDRSIDQKGREITYKINVEYSGFCFMHVYDMNWVIIPKLRKKDKVIFEVEQTNSN